MKPDVSLAERFETLLRDHLSDRDASRFGPAAHDAATTLGLGEWPVALTDATRSGSPGLWVLTTERSLWLSHSADIEDDDTPWREVESVAFEAGPGGHDLVVGRRKGASALVFGNVGTSTWAHELEWAVGGLAQLDGEPRFYCPECLIGTHDAGDGDCLICAAPLLVLPGSDLGDGPVAGRLRRLASPDVVRSLTPAVAAAELALTPDDWLWVVTDATFRDAPVLVVANETWIRVWNTKGEICLDFLHDEITVLRSEDLGSGAGVDFLEHATGRIVAIDCVGATTWVDDLIARTEADPDGEASPMTEALGPVLSEDGTTRCPLCAEEIQSGAKICRFCRTDFRIAGPPIDAPDEREVSFALQFLGVLLVITSVFFFRVVGIPVTETYGPDGYSESWSWGHIVGYTAIGVAGGGLLWLGEQKRRT